MNGQRLPPATHVTILHAHQTLCRLLRVSQHPDWQVRSELVSGFSRQVRYTLPALTSSALTPREMLAALTAALVAAEMLRSADGGRRKE